MKFIISDLAQRIAQANDKALLNDVLIGQAKQAFDNNDFSKAESYLLQAQRPDLAVKLYRDNGTLIILYRFFSLSFIWIFLFRFSSRCFTCLSRIHAE